MNDTYRKYRKYKTKYLNLKKSNQKMESNEKMPVEVLMPNLNLLRDHGTDGSFYKWKKELGIPNDDAFCLKFSMDVPKQKILYYIGAMHTFDIESLTYQYIHQIISVCVTNQIKSSTTTKSTIVLIEGIPVKYGISPSLKNHQGEGKYAGDLAINLKIPFSGIEGDEDHILIDLKNKYGVMNIYGFLYLRMHKYYYRTMKATEKEFNEDFNTYEVPRLNHLFGEILFYPKIWFKQTFGKNFSHGKFLEYSSPHNNTKIITKQIAFDYGKVRDQINMVNLYRFLNEYDIVVYIMGQNHVYADIKVLEDTFGDPQAILFNSGMNC